MEERVELNLHTNTSADTSIISPRMAIDAVVAMGQKAVAITDLDSAQSFYDITFAKDLYAPKIKLIYGAELKDDNGTYTVLVKDQEGLKSLYRKLSGKEITPQQREHLLVGSSHQRGELYRAVSAGVDPERLREIASRYDYIELFANRDNEAHRTVNKRLYILGKALSIPVVAVGGCHYVLPEEKICKRILDTINKHPLHGKQEALHMRTTEEMLKAFSYLGEKEAYEVVVTNTNAIADSIGYVETSGCLMPRFSSPEACEEVHRICREKLEELYGKEPPEEITGRLEEELSFVDHNAGVYLLAHRLAKHMKEMGATLGTRGAIGSTLMGYLLDISQINPLPAHYYCSQCGYVEFRKADSGYDLGETDCPHCHMSMKGDGQNIPYETFLQATGDGYPIIDINVPQRLQTEAVAFLAECMGKERIAYAGNMFTYMRRVAESFVRVYGQVVEGNAPTETEVARLGEKLYGVKAKDSMLPFSLVLLPEGMEWEDVTPIRHLDTPVCGIDKVTHMEYHDIMEALPKINIMSYSVLDRIDEMFAATGVEPEEIGFDDPTVYELFYNLDTCGIPEFSSHFCKGIFSQLTDIDFSNLVRVSGMAHGTEVWTDNGENLIHLVAPFRELISTRDDIFLTLRDYGIDGRTAFSIMTATRKGRFSMDTDIHRRWTALMEQAGVPDWYIRSMKKIRYLFPKAHAAHYVKTAVIYAWFKRYYPETFYNVTLRAWGAEKYVNCTDEELEQMRDEMDDGHGFNQEVEAIHLLLEARHRNVPIDL